MWKGCCYHRVWGDDLPGMDKSFSFRIYEKIIGAKVCECFAFRMELVRFVQCSVQDRERQASHQDIKGSATKMTSKPQERQEVLRDHEVRCLVSQEGSEMIREPFIEGEQCLLSRGSLRSEPSQLIRSVQDKRWHLFDMAET